MPAPAISGGKGAGKKTLQDMPLGRRTTALAYLLLLSNLSRYRAAAKCVWGYWRRELHG